VNCQRDVDAHVSTVLDALEATGQLDRTIVVYTADHGELGGAHGTRQKGCFVYRENLHVPLVVAHPDVRGPSTIDAVSSMLDLPCTILGLAGLADAERRTLYPEMRGHDLSSLVARPDDPGPRAEEQRQVAAGRASDHAEAFGIDGELARMAADPPRRVAHVLEARRERMLGREAHSHRDRRDAAPREALAPHEVHFGAEVCPRATVHIYQRRERPLAARSHELELDRVPGAPRDREARTYERLRVRHASSSRPSS